MRRAIFDHLSCLLCVISFALLFSIWSSVFLVCIFNLGEVSGEIKYVVLPSDPIPPSSA